MSTYKVQPVYAEMILGWLDLDRLEIPDAGFDDVLRFMSWNFKGGTLGDYPMMFPSESSMTCFPSGSSMHLVEEGYADKNYTALRALVARRARDQRKRTRAFADWAASYAACRAISRMEGCTRPAVSGLHSVYVLMSRLWTSALTKVRGEVLRHTDVFTREMCAASAASSHLHVPTALEIASAVSSATAASRLPSLLEIVDDIVRLVRHVGSPEARQTARTVGRRVLSGDISVAGADFTDLRTASIRIANTNLRSGHGWACFIHGEDLHVLSRSDIVRLHQLAISISSGLYATIAQACVAPGSERLAVRAIGLAYEAQVDRVLSMALKCPPGDEVYACKALKRAFSAYLGELSGPLCATETVELWEEAFSTKHADPGILARWVDEIRPWSAGTAFNLGKVYKVCPAPDASPALTLIERHEMVTNRNMMEVGAQDTFRTALRAQILRAYIRGPGVRLSLRNDAIKPAWWSSYKAAKFDDVPSAEIHEYLAWEGTATMPARTPQDPSVWKDSGLGWDSWDVAVDPFRNPMHGNMLTRMIFDPQCPMPGVRHTPAEHAHKIDTKPEGHKDPARGIYSGNIAERLNQSWMEAAVDDVAQFHPAYMIGADAETREARVRALTDRVHKPNEVAVYYSFDISGWSPRMPPEAQEISHQLWAELYNENLFRSARTINEAARIYMNKGGFTGWYFNTGSNLEGYNGKEMTMILIALMARTVLIWRRELVAARLATVATARGLAAMLLAYIDDGLAKLVLPRGPAAAMFELFKECTVREFGACGYKIEVSKCYPSDRFAVFLNEPYLAGHHVVHGTRAAMTICAENTEPHTTILERVTSVATGCRGAVAAGLDGLTATLLLAYHVYRHIREWVFRPDPVASAVWAMFPRAWGGLGCPTALQMSTSGGGSASVESVYCAQKWAQISLPARRCFLICARSTFSNRTPTGILLSPLGGRLKDGPMIESRVPDAVRLALANLRSAARLSALAEEFLAFSSPDSLADYAGALVHLSTDTTLQDQLLRDLASAHPHALFSAFAQRIEKSATLIKLIGFRSVLRIIKANRRDAVMSYRIMKARSGGI